MLKEKLFGQVNEKQDEYLDDILSSSNHLLALINDILDLSKVEAGQVELERRLFSLREALERGVVMVRERAVQNGVELSLELDPQVDLVEGDERRIQQVVFNLLSNAVKFTPSGGRVDVSTAKEDGEVRIAVRDTGPGISPDDQARIFEEFQQARDTNGERPEGTGLGLALSRSLVELHGGPHLGRVGAGQGLHLHLHPARGSAEVKERVISVLTSLTGKYVAVFVLLVAVPAIGISWYLLDSSYNDNKAALIREQQARADALAGKVEDDLSGMVRRLKSVHLDGLSNEKIDAVLDGMNRIEPGIAFYVDASGQVSSADLVGVSIENPGESFKIARHKGVYRGDVSTDGLMSILAAENAGPGLVGTNLFPADKFKKLIGGARFGRSGYAYAATGSGVPIAHPDRNYFHRYQIGQAKGLDALPQVRSALKSDGLTGSGQGRDVRGRKVLSAWATVDPVGWKVFVEQPESAAFAPLRGKIWGTALIIAAFVLAAIALSILLARRLVRPIKRLQVAAEAIGAGAYDERIELERQRRARRPCLCLQPRWPLICRS